MQSVATLHPASNLQVAWTRAVTLGLTAIAAAALFLVVLLGLMLVAIAVGPTTYGTVGSPI